MRGQSLYDYCMEHEDKKYLLDEWDYEKNEKELGLSPKDISRGIHIKVYWKCRVCDNSWLAYLTNRLYRSYGCPECAKKDRGLSRSKSSAYSGNDFASNYPELLKDWDYEKNVILPEEVSRKSSKKVWWKCDKGHSYDATVAHRVVDKTSCPYCSNQKVLKGYNDVATTHPELVKEWDYEKNEIDLGLNPDMVSAGSSIKVNWICGTCGNKWVAEVRLRVYSNHNCPKCDKEKHSSFSEQAIYYYLRKVYNEVENGRNDLLGNKLELDIYIPEIKTAIEYDGVRWHKDINKDLKKNKLCQEKGIRLIRIREDGLPNIEGSVNIFRVDKDSDKGLEVVLNELISKLGVSIDINIERDRQQIYSQYVYSKKENSLASKFPEIAREWHPTKNGGLTPENVSMGSHKNVWWLCDKGHSYDMVIHKKTIRSDGCPYCSGHRVLKGFNDLCTTHSELVKEWNYEKNGDLTPDRVTKGSTKKVWWKCSLCGHEYERKIVGQTKIKGITCPICAKKNRKS